MFAVQQASELDCGGKFPHGFFRVAPSDTEKLPSDLQENPVFDGEVDRFPFSDSASPTQPARGSSDRNWSLRLSGHAVARGSSPARAEAMVLRDATHIG